MAKEEEITSEGIKKLFVTGRSGRETVEEAQLPMIRVKGIERERFEKFSDSDNAFILSNVKW